MPDICCAICWRRVGEGHRRWPHLLVRVRLFGLLDWWRHVRAKPPTGTAAVVYMPRAPAKNDVRCGRCGGSIDSDEKCFARGPALFHADCLGRP